MQIYIKAKKLYPIVIFFLVGLIISAVLLSYNHSRNVTSKNLNIVLTDFNEMQSDEKLPNAFHGQMGFSPLDPKPAYKLGASFPKVPEKLMIYKIIKPQPLTESDVREFGQKRLDFPPEAKFDLGIIYTLETKTSILSIFPDTGFFNFSLRKKDGEQYSKKREDYLSDEECLKIAVDFLREKGLWEDDIRLPVQITGDDFSTTSNGSVDVWFGSKIGDYKTTGGGRRLEVGVGTDGKVRSVLKNWIRVEPWKLAPIKTPQEAYKELQEGKAVFVDYKGGKIDHIEIRYDMPISVEGYVQPVYYFNIGNPGGLYIEVPAVRSEYILSDEQKK
jgi:hypothetical protein